MGCVDLHGWYLRRHLAVINLASPDWLEAREAARVTPGVGQSVCLRRLVDRGLLRHVRRGLYIVVDQAREVPQVAVASGAFSHLDHYITTDAALVAHGLLDQPIPVITVIVPREGLTPFEIGRALVRPVQVSAPLFGLADQYATTVESYAVRLASRAQAVLDALAEPRWMTHFSLLPEVIQALDEGEVDQLVRAALARSQAATQRLGFLLEDAGQPVPEGLGAFVPSRAAELTPGHRTGIFSTRWRIYG